MKTKLPAKSWSLISGFMLLTVIFSAASTAGLSTLTITSSVSPASCAGNSDGAITIEVNGGTGLYSYSWSSPDHPGFSSTSQNVSGLDPGTYEVTVTDEDNLEIKSDPLLVEVVDTEIPVITAVDLNIELPGSSCTANIDPVATASDNCSVGTPTGSREDGESLTAPFPIGTTVITWNVTDINGNDAIPVFQNITVKDTVAPVVIAQDISLQLNELGTVDIIPADVDNGSSDNCGFTLSLDKSSFDCSNLGANTVLLSSTDKSGNKESATAIVTIEDSILPVIKAGNILQSADPGACGAIINPGAEAADNCGIDQFIGIRSDGLALTDQFPIGTTTITWNATDLAGNPATEVVQTISISDSEHPVIVAADILQSTDAGKCTAIVTMTATATDNCDVGNLTGVRDDKLALTDEFPIGTTSITWNVSDVNNLDAIPVVQKITISDKEAPVITAGSDIIQSTDPGFCYAHVTISPATAADNCTVDVPTGTRSDGEPLDAPYPTGVTKIFWNTTDINGNPAETVVQHISVFDGEAPQQPILPDITTSCAITLSPPLAADNCTISSMIKVTTEDPTTYLPQNNISEHIVTWKFEDKAGNTVFANQKLIINPIIISSEVIPVTCNGGSDGSINITANGGEAPYLYSFGDGEFGSETFFSNLTAGNYSVRIQDATGCIAEKIIAVEEPEALLFTASGGDETLTTPETCFGAQDGSITINGITNGGNSSYEYSVDNINFGSNPIMGLSAGSYEVFIRDTNGCRLSRTLSAVVPGPAQLDANVEMTHLKCFDSYSGSIKITNPTGGNDNLYSFRVNGGDWQSNSSSLGYNFTALAADSYTVDMKDSTGCLRTIGIFELNQPDKVVVNVETTRTTTYGSTTGTATANPTGGDGIYTYEWTDAAGNIIGNTKSIIGLKAGSYTVKILDGQGCTAVKSLEIVDVITADINMISLCKDTDDLIRTSTFQVDLDKTMGGQGDPIKYTYVWNFGEGASLPPGTTGMGAFEVTYSSVGDKIITLVVTDEAKQTQIFTFNHYVGACFETCDSANNFSSNPNSFYLGDADGNKMEVNDCDLSEPIYLWFIVNKSANGYILNSEFIYTVSSGSTTKQYRATNCFSNTDGSMLQPGQLVRLNQVGTGDNQIHWKCDEMLNIIHITYRWTINPGKDCGNTNNNHCASSNETMSVAAPIRAIAETSDTCHGQTDGSIIVYAYGGTGTFVYSAVNTGTGATYTSDINVFNGLPAGTYTVTVTDKKEVAAGQVKSYFVIDNLIIGEADSALSAEVIAQDVSCYAEKDGWGKVTPTGGTPPYSYLWNDPDAQISQQAVGLGAGTYTVTVTDALGCTVTKSVEITEPPALSIPNAGPDQTWCGYNSSTLSANTPTTGTGKWEIMLQPTGATAHFDDPSNPQSVFTGTNGKYVLRWVISDSSNICSKFDEVEITIIEDCSYLDFDGVDDYVDTGNRAFNFSSGTFSMEAWVKLKTTSGTRTILSKKNPATSGGYELIISTGGIPGFRTASGTIFANTTSNLNTERWYHIAATFDGAILKLFVDGLQVNAQAAVNPASTTAPFLIGATSEGTTTRASSHFKGWIEEVRLWNTALTTEQLRFMMNQRLEKGTPEGGATQIPVKGKILPMNVPGQLTWGQLAGYYPLLASDAVHGGGYTNDLADGQVHGVLKNITTYQENTAPLPYVSKRDGNWRDIEGSTTPWLYGRGRWDAPNSLGINNQPINWNIVQTSHDIISGNKDITVLGLISKDKQLLISNPNFVKNEKNPGHFLRVTHYLKLDGSIDLVGESQLLQDQGSILDSKSSGYLERDQQGTGSSFNYNYWSSPVSSIRDTTQINLGYTIDGALWGGTNSNSPHKINFGGRYAHADGALTSPIKISTYWLYKFYGEAGKYSQWKWLGKDGILEAGQGFTMKGSQYAHVSSGIIQNYVFRGLPNNGDINLDIVPGTNYLVGNPYPSALDANEFIKDNLAARSGTNVFNGSLYFWSHFSGQTHYLQRYEGGYATYNLSGGVKAVASDTRIKATGESGGLIPKRYIPVGQAFFLNTIVDDKITNWTTSNPAPLQSEIVAGQVKFKNSQRIFQRENMTSSVFHTQEQKNVVSPLVVAQKEERMKIWLKSISPLGYHRQLLLTADKESSLDFDLGYDAPSNDNVEEDMYWLLHDTEFVIQGVPNFSSEQEIPIGLKVAQEGEFTIGIDNLENIPADFAIHLKDSLNNESTHDLRNSDFVFRAEPGEIKGRFSIIFLNEKQQPVEEEKEIEEAEKEEVLHTIGAFYSSNEKAVTITNPHNIKIHRALLFNINGQQLRMYNEISPDNGTKLPVDEKTSGIYILRLETEEGTRPLKLIIK